MDKRDIGLRVSKIAGCPATVAVSCISSYIEIIKELVVTEGQAKISGFGTFRLHTKQARRFWNIHKKSFEYSSPIRYVKFKPSKKFLDVIPEGMDKVFDIDEDFDCDKKEMIEKEKARLKRQIADLDGILREIEQKESGGESID